MTGEDSKKHFSLKLVAYILAVAGLIGFVASFMLTIETIKVYQNPSYIPTCSINPILNCRSLMETSQATVLGFANSLMGVAAFAGITVVGFGLLAGATFKKWFWQGLFAGAALGLVFIHWLIFESLYSIGSLCPFCMAVWAAMIPIFWYVLLFNLSEGYLGRTLSKNRVARFMLRHHVDIVIMWFIVIVALVLNRFWYYFGQFV